MGGAGGNRDKARRTPLTVAVAGSRRLPRAIAPRVMARFLSRLADGSVVLLRRGRDSEPGQFESDVDVLCERMRVGVKWFSPDSRHGGRASVFLRDIEMVMAADMVVLFITEEDAASGYSGTFHMFDKALDDQKPVYAWSVSKDGHVERWGETDDSNEYAWLFD